MVTAEYDDKRVSPMLLVMVVVGDAGWVWWQEGIPYAVGNGSCWWC